MVAAVIEEFRHRESYESDESLRRKRPKPLSSSIPRLQDSLDSPDSRCLPLHFNNQQSSIKGPDLENRDGTVLRIAAAFRFILEPDRVARAKRDAEQEPQDEQGGSCHQHFKRQTL